jgi:hypothetical protein
LANYCQKLWAAILSWRFHLKDSSHIQTNYFLNHHKPFKQGLSFMILWLTEMHTEQMPWGAMATIAPMLARSADAMFFGLPDLQILYLD